MINSLASLACACADIPPLIVSPFRFSVVLPVSFDFLKPSEGLMGIYSY